MVLLVAMGLMSVKPHQLYRLGFMISIAGFLIIQLLSHPSSTVMLALTAAIIIVGDTVFDAFVWIIGSEFSDFAGRHSDFKPFAIVHAVVALSLCCGILISCALFQVSAFPFLFGHATTIICYLLIIHFGGIVSSERHGSVGNPQSQTLFGSAGSEIRLWPNGQRRIGRVIRGKAWSDIARKRCLMLILGGRSVKKMAEELVFSEHTIVSHVRHIDTYTERKIAILLRS